MNFLATQGSSKSARRKLLWHLVVVTCLLAPILQGVVGATGRAGLDGIPGRDVRLAYRCNGLLVCVGHSASAVSLLCLGSPRRERRARRVG